MAPMYVTDKKDLQLQNTMQHVINAKNALTH